MKALGRSTESKAVTRRGSVALLSSASLLPTLLATLSGPLAARALGQDGRGQAAAVTAFAAGLPLLLSLGSALAIGQRAAVEPEKRSALYGSAILMSLIAVPFAIALSAAIMVGPLGSLRGSVRLLAWLSLGVSPLAVLSLSVQQLLIAEGALGPIARMRSLPLAISFVLTVVLFFTEALTVTTYLATNLFAGLASFAVGLACLAERPRTGYPLRDLLGFGLRGFMGSVATMANSRLDQMIMVPVLGAAQLGNYAVAVSVASFPLAFGQAVSARSFGELATAKDRPAAASQYLRLTCLIVGSACLLLALVTPVLVPLVYGRAFAGSVNPLLVLLPGITVLAIVHTSSTLLTILGRPGLNSWAEFCGVGVTLVGLLLLIEPLGILGAALVSTISYSSILAIHLTFLRRMGITGVVPRQADIAFVRSRIKGIMRVRRPDPGSVQ